MNVSRRRLGLLAVSAIAIVAVSIPTFAASPAPSGPPGQTKPEKPPKGPKVEVTVRGTLVKGTDEKGRPTFTITTGGKTWEISAGPKWFLGDKNPLGAYAGDTVTVVGTHREGDLSISVDTVNGKEIRAAGKPAWAGGPRAVGEKHPGWKGWKGSNGDKPGNGVGREGAPGQDKKASPAP